MRKIKSLLSIFSQYISNSYIYLLRTSKEWGKKMSRKNTAEIIDFEFYTRFGMILFSHHSLHKKREYSGECEPLYVVKNTSSYYNQKKAV